MKPHASQPCHPRRRASGRPWTTSHPPAHPVLGRTQARATPGCRSGTPPLLAAAAAAAPCVLTSHGAASGSAGGAVAAPSLRGALQRGLRRLGREPRGGQRPGHERLQGSGPRGGRLQGRAPRRGAERGRGRAAGTAGAQLRAAVAGVRAGLPGPELSWGAPPALGLLVWCRRSRGPQGHAPVPRRRCWRTRSAPCAWGCAPATCQLACGSGRRGPRPASAGQGRGPWPALTPPSHSVWGVLASPYSGSGQTRGARLPRSRP